MKTGQNPWMPQTWEERCKNKIYGFQTEILGFFTFQFLEFNFYNRKHNIQLGAIIRNSPSALPFQNR